MKSVTRILTSQSAGLQTLLERAAILKTINEHFIQQLPAPLKDHLCLANIRDDAAIIMADSGAWLTQARYQGSEILNILRQEPGLEQLKKLLFKITPPQSSHHEPVVHPQMSEGTAELLMSTAKVIDDPKLKTALHKLSRRHQKS